MHQKKEGDCSVHIPEENQNQEPAGGKYIFRVNAALTKSNPDAYKPKLISIGPYHMQDPELNKDNVKQNFKNSLCQKIDKFEDNSKAILYDMLKDTRSCYNDDIPDMKDEEFVDMLLLDGCFILEFMEKYSNKVADDGCERTKVQTLIDMTLLENQIPFFVLFELFKLKHNNANKDDGVLVQDLMVLVRKCIATQVPNARMPNAECNDYGGIIEKMNSAAVLAKEGVGFKKIGKVYERYFEMEDGVKTFNATDSTTLFDLYFSNWVLKIPSFKIDGHTETLLRNMIAYEQQSTDAAPVWFSDYVSFMDKLIKSAHVMPKRNHRQLHGFKR
nr:putative UPF0481 protein At3g02645 isoform X3 [Ipomoea trifida]